MDTELGDIVEADTSGVVIALCTKAEDVARIAHEIEKTESRISALNHEGTRANIVESVLSRTVSMEVWLSAPCQNRTLQNR